MDAMAQRQRGQKELQERAKEQSFGNIFFAPTRHLFWWQTKEGPADELDLKKSIH